MLISTQLEEIMLLQVPPVLGVANIMTDFLQDPG